MSEEEEVKTKPKKQLRFKEDEEEEEESKEETKMKNGVSDDEDDDGMDIVTFEDMGIDDRLLMAIIQLKWLIPTSIQEAAIPMILEGRDILAKARTGSGKTGAYAIPLINKILNMKKYKASKQVTSALILTPSRELCSQAYRNMLDLIKFCQREITVMDLSTTQLTAKSQKQILTTRPDIIISTPTKILEHLKEDQHLPYAIDLKSTLELLVIDEADLLLSFGYEEDMKQLVNFLPKSVQTILLSATLNDDVKAVKKIYLHNPAILKLKDSAELPDPMQLEQYQISCSNEEDKCVLIYSIFKLQLVRGKSLIFVNTVNRCYKLKIFLENFGIRSCALNSELPINSRMHIIEQFNGGLYDILIASDEKFIDNSQTSNESNESSSNNNKKAKQQADKRKDKEYNISRGIDFQNVSNVINFDFPASTKSYIHRVGRTARGTSRGTALSLVDSTEYDRLLLVEDELKQSFNYKSTSLSNEEQSLDDLVIFKQFKFKMDEIEGFRYRARDVLRSITSVAIKEARLKEIKLELLNSEKLKSYFEENPREMDMLRHDKELHVTKLDEHLKNVPEYIIPPSMRGLKLRANNNNKKRKFNNNSNNGKKNYHKKTIGQMKYHKKSSDPLKSFNFAGLKKTKKSYKK